MYCHNCVYGQDRASILGLRSSGCNLNYLKWSQIVKFTSVIREEIKGGGEINNTSSWNLIPVISTRKGGIVCPVLKSFPYIGRISYDSTKEPNWRFRALHFKTNLNCFEMCGCQKQPEISRNIFYKSSPTILKAYFIFSFLQISSQSSLSTPISEYKYYVKLI